MSHANFDQDQEQLNQQPRNEGVLECRGRIQGEYPIYLPDSALLAAKIVKWAHVTTLHGGVGLTMARVREKFWITRLRKLTKRVVKKCSGCKRFQAVAFANPPPATLPRERTEGSTPFCWRCSRHPVFWAEPKLLASWNRPAAYWRKRWCSLWCKVMSRPITPRTPYSAPQPPWTVVWQGEWAERHDTPQPYRA